MQLDSTLENGSCTETNPSFYVFFRENVKKKNVIQNCPCEERSIIEGHSRIPTIGLGLAKWKVNAHVQPMRLCRRFLKTAVNPEKIYVVHNQI